MAVAAFRSTTKRSTLETDGASFSVSSRKGGHRRTKSFTDSSCAYLSDSSSSSGYKLKPFPGQPSSDSESDADGSCGNYTKGRPVMTQVRCEPRYMSQLQRQTDEPRGYESASSSISKQRRSPSYQNLSQISKQSVPSVADGGGGNYTAGRSVMTEVRHEPRYMAQLQRRIDEPRGYESASSSSISKHRRSSSYQDLCQISKQSVSRDRKKSENKHVAEDQSEMQEVEERTIRAVHAQTKPYERDPPAGDADNVGLYAMMRAEVQRAVEDLKKEFQQSLGERLSNSQISEGSLENIVKPVDGELTEDASDISNVYAARLHQSEQRARELRLQLEEEERRSADIAKSVGKLHLDTGSIRARKSRRGTDRQMVSKSLDEDARRYFEECVGILKLENSEAEESFSDGPSSAHLQQNISFLSKGHAIQSSPPQESPLKQNDMDHLIMDKKPTKIKTRPVNDDGVVMPWLDWECDRDANSITSRQEDPKFQQISKELSSISDIPTSDGSVIGSVSGYKRADWRCLSSTLNINPRQSVQTYRNEPSFDSDNEIFTSEIDQLPSSQLQSSIGSGGHFTGNLKLMKMVECSSITKEVRSIHLEDTNRISKSMDKTASVLVSDDILSQRKLYRSRIAQGRLLLCGGKS
ncbi:hypothetical protein O6H91_14G051400 [Diphasiastrum complanatum]|uniref:Uncharacterized protein n=2 Tax=Diphasiastrum complanatum TaxID=34168 RepID=A0ACC2BPK5_DIPCM|nr:hypothetical protein O6H91_14G051400 [Diphasiastrum complanatum]KAJ7531623.1 hypothetical protein O6H91_14G051400 [Diphasiastrum complanatum]